MKKFANNALVFVSALSGLFLPLFFVGENTDIISKLIYSLFYILSGFLFIYFGKIFATDKNKIVYILTKIGIYFFGFITLVNILLAILNLDKFNELIWEGLSSIAVLIGIIIANKIFFKK